MYLEYASSQDAGLRLFGHFAVPDEPQRLLVQMHGWHGTAASPHSDNIYEQAFIPEGWFLIRPEMRGRGEATGAQDCNGWELQDVVDAVRFARAEFAEKIIGPELVALSGGSGGGGNVLGLVGKFPDFFCRAHCDCGISDYGRWHRNDAVGDFRDEMEGAGWIGGNPETRGEAYASRGGLTTVKNLLTPLLVFHGADDPRVPVEQARLYVEKATDMGKGGLVTYYELEGIGHSLLWDALSPEQRALRERVVDSFMAGATEPVAIPRQGSFVVAGYLKTREFEVVLDSIDHVGMVDYDLDKGEFSVRAVSAERAFVRVGGEEKEVAVEQCERV